MNANKPSENTILPKRQLLHLVTLTALAPIWVKPLINSVVLPAHAQTSMVCTADAITGGPLAGNASGATNCADACAAEAADQNAQLCAVIETNLPSGTECSCELDLP